MQVSTDLAVTTPVDATVHEVGVSEVADHAETREVGTLMNERYGEV